MRYNQSTTLKWAARICWALLGVAVAGLSLYFLQAQSLPDLEYWHKEDVAAELVPQLEWLADADLSAYLDHEARVLEYLQDTIRARDIDLPAWHRYNKVTHETYRKAWPGGNASVLQTPDDHFGAALLVHGLSDSPYSMHALAKGFYGAGFQTLNLRMPGHGTFPGALQRVNWRHFQATFQLGVRALVRDLQPGEPLVLVGYSNGAALAVDYALQSIVSNGELTRPDLLVLVSPAMQVSSVAAYARIQRWVSKIPGLEKLGWTDVVPEFDPFKYNSFPVYAGEQIYKLTTQMQKRLDQLSVAQRDAFPAVIAFQSVVDSTISPRSVITGLLDKLSGSPAELVLFDINRSASILPMLRPTAIQLERELQARPALGFGLTVVGSSSSDSGQVSIRAKSREGGNWVESVTPMRWPERVYSLSHVALPFSARDPVYGPDKPDGIMRVGDLWFKGEQGTLSVPLKLLARQRYNPFYPYMEKRILAAAERALVGKKTNEG